MNTLEDAINHLDKVLWIADGWIMFPGQMSDEARQALTDACAAVHDFRCEDIPLKGCDCRACEKARA